MKAYDAIPAKVWNKLTVEEKESLVMYLRFIGFPITGLYFDYSDMPVDNELLLDHTGDLWLVFHKLGVSKYRLSEDEVRKMIEMSPV